MHDLLRALLSPLDDAFSDSPSSFAYSYTNDSKPHTAYAPYAYVLAQLAPLLVLLGLPALALLARAHWAALVRLSHMVLETLFGVALPLPWGWGGGGSGQNNGVKGGEEGDEKRRRRKEREKGWRTHRSRVGVNGELTEKDSELELEDEDEDLFYPGLVNISGTYCFLNSVLQATASLAYLQPHLDAIHARAVELDVPTPVVDTLQETLQALNTPKTSRSSFRPMPMINALSQPVPGTRGRSKLFASREHQDAQELFQLLSECIKSEAQAVDAEAQRDRGLGAFASSSRSTDDTEVELSASGVFDGLTANRRSCVACGYTEAVMHFAFATWSLALPAAGYGGSCALQECLAEYTRLELLTDCVCRRCSMRATHARLREEAERLAEATRPGGPSSGSQYKKKKAKEAKRLERQVAAAIEAGRIEEDVKGVKMERVVSSASTKQAMVARPPKILVLHLNRSLHFGGAYTSRNPIRVRFPEILDLTPYTTSGQLSTAPSSPISAPPPAVSVPRCTTPTQGLYATPRVLYRLSAVVAHYGAHSYGHYVCFRRKPRFSSEPTSSSATAHPTVPQMPCPYGCDCTLCTSYGPVRDLDPNPNSNASSQSHRVSRPGRGWLRISDDAVEECGLERVLAEGSGAFLLFYECVQNTHVARLRADTRLGLGGIYQHLQMRGSTPRSSEETVRPADVVSAEEREGGGSVSVSSSLSTSGGFGERMREREREALVRPRVVRRTTAGRRERSRDVEDKPKEKVSLSLEEEEDAGAEAEAAVAAAAEAEKLVENGDSASKMDRDDVANGSAVPPHTGGLEPDPDPDAEPEVEPMAQVEVEVDLDLDLDLSESVVRVELPSPPRTPSPAPSPSRREHLLPTRRPMTSSSSSASGSQLKKNEIEPRDSEEWRTQSLVVSQSQSQSPSPSPSRLPLPSPSSSSTSTSAPSSSSTSTPSSSSSSTSTSTSTSTTSHPQSPRSAPLQVPRTPSPTPSPSPSLSPSSSRKSAKSRIPRPRGGASASASASASGSGSSSSSSPASASAASSIVPDRASVGLRA